MSSSGEPITKCPVCRYDLTGVPRNYRCPECGFEYNERMRMWHAPMMPWWNHVVFAIAAALFGLQVARSVRRGDSAVDTLLAAAPLVMWIFFYVTLMRRHVYVLVSDEGLLNVGGGWRRTSRFYQWQDIWIPDPEKRFAVPAWHEGEGGTKSSALFGDAQKGSPHIRVRPVEGDYTGGSGAVRLDAIHRLPVRARRIAMAEIHRRWREATGRDAPRGSGEA